MRTFDDPRELFGQVAEKAVEGVRLWAEANQRVLQGLADFSAGTAKEGVRLYAELQSSGVEAVKDAQGYWLRRQGELAEAQKDPFGWYQKTVLEGVEQTQRNFKLLEGSAQALGRSAERVQATAEQTAKEIQQTFAALAENVRALYTPSQS